MLIEYTDKDADRRDELLEKYGEIDRDTWKSADTYEDAMDLFDKFQRRGDEIEEFGEYWDDPEDEFDDEDEYDDDYEEDDEYGDY